MFSTPAAVRCTLKSRSFDSKYSMLRRPSLICPSRRESTAGLLVDWRMVLAALIRALSLSILRCTLATVSSTLDMAAGVCQFRRGGRWCVSPPTGAARWWWCLATESRRVVECAEPKQAPVVQCDAVHGESRVVERWAKEYGGGCWGLPVAMTAVGGDSVMSSKPSRELRS
jgi:hypothetical protein